MVNFPLPSIRRTLKLGHFHTYRSFVVRRSRHVVAVSHNHGCLWTLTHVSNDAVHYFGAVPIANGRRCDNGGRGQRQAVYRCRSIRMKAFIDIHGYVKRRRINCRERRTAKSRYAWKRPYCWILCVDLRMKSELYTFRGALI